MTWHSWQGRSPGGSTDENCIIMNDKGLWLDVSCTTQSANVLCLTAKGSLNRKGEKFICWVFIYMGLSYVRHTCDCHYYDDLSQVVTFPLCANPKGNVPVGQIRNSQLPLIFASFIET